MNEKAIVRTRFYGSVDDIKTAFKNLTEYTPQEILQNFPALYWRVYTFARKNEMQVNMIWTKIGLKVLRVYHETFKSDAEFIEWGLTEKLIEKNIKDLSAEQKEKIFWYARSEEVTVASLYEKLKIEYKTHVYKTVQSIKDDLEAKGLIGKTPSEVEVFDGNKTIANIRRFAERNSYNINHFYPLVGLKHSARKKIVKGVLITAAVYDSVEAIRTDLEAKKLIGKTAQDIARYDFSKTYANIHSFAERNNISIRTLWKTLGIAKHQRIRSAAVIPDFSSEEDISAYLTKEKIPLELKYMRLFHKKAYEKILDYANGKKMPKGEIWKKLGTATRMRVLNTIEDVISLLSRNNLSAASLKDIRNNSSIYDAICGFAKKKKSNVSDIWNLLGIKKVIK